MYSILEAFEELNKLNEDTARSQYDIDHNVYHDKKQLVNDGFTKQYSSSDWRRGETGYFGDITNVYGDHTFPLYKRTIDYKNPENNKTATLVQYAYEYAIDDRYSGYKYKKKLISREEFYKAMADYQSRQNKANLDKLTTELDDLRANNFNIDSIGTSQQANELSQRLEVFEEEGLMTHDEADNIRQEINRELNSKGWCVVLVLSDSYAKSHKDSYSRIEKSNLTKYNAFLIAKTSNEPVYTKLNVADAWEYEPMKMADAKKFLAKRNKEEDMLKQQA